MLKIESSAPTRIDLAGGTLDLWPLHLLIDRPAVTVNLGINLHARVSLESDAQKSGGKIELEAADQGVRAELSWADLATYAAPPALQLHHKLLRHFARKAAQAQGLLRISTRAQSPAGAGLGGSSTLGVALSGALESWATGGSPINPDRDGDRLIETVRDIETTVIRVPAGVQDYFGAMYGGLLALEWGPGQLCLARGGSQEPSLLAALERRIALFYSGHSRNSGINNWALFKALVDGQNQKSEKTRESFERIADAATRLNVAIKKSAWDEAGIAIAEEWQVRRTLAQGISTPEIDASFAEAEKLGVRAGKICGAGGGGCFFFWLPSEDPALRDRLVKAVTALGPRELPFKSASPGLTVTPA